MQSLEEITRFAISPNNELRNRAESSLISMLSHNPDSVHIGLADILVSGDMDIAQVCAILLRQYAIRSDVWGRVGVDAKRYVVDRVAGLIGNPQIPRAIYLKIADLFAVLVVTEKNQELENALKFLLSSNSALQREAGLRALSSLAEFRPQEIVSGLQEIKVLLMNCLQFPDSADVRIFAVQAAISVTLCIEKKQFPIMLETIPLIFKNVVETQDEMSVRDAVASLVHLAGASALFFKPYLQDVVRMFLQMAASRHYEPATRQICFEFLTVLAENGKTMIRKAPIFVEGVFALAFELLNELDDAIDFSNKDGDEEQEIFLVGYDSIPRLVAALGESRLSQIVLQLLQQNIQHKDWIRRHSSLVLIEKVADSSEKLFVPVLESLASTVLSFMNDAVPRIRYAAVNSLAALSYNYYEQFQSSCGESVLKGVLGSLSSESDLRVRVQGIYFLSQFFENAVEENVHELLAPTVEFLNSAFQFGLQNSNLEVVEKTVSALSNVASISKDAFSGYYDVFVPGLLYVIRHCNSLEHSTLRGKALECIAFIGSCSGRDRFANDAKQILDYLVNLGDSLSFDLYTQSAFARIGQVLQDWFIPYLDFIVPKLIEAAKLEGGFTISECADKLFGSSQEEDQDDSIQSFNINIRGLGDRKITINSAVLEQKATGVNMLYQYALDFGSAFAKFVVPVAQTIVPLLTCAYSEEVRIAAVASLPVLVKCLNEAEGNIQLELFEFLFDKIVLAIKMEPKPESLVDIIAALGECLSEINHPLETLKIVTLCELFSFLMSDSEERKALKQEELGEDYDELEDAEYQNVLEIESQILGTIVDCIQSLVRNSESEFAQIFLQNLSSKFESLLDPKRSADDRASALCVFDEVLEFGGKPMKPFVSNYSPILLNYAKDQDENVVQSAVYGLGVCAQVNPLSFAPFSGGALELLAPIIDSGSESHARDNAISAYGKIILNCSNALPVENLLPLWLRCLPLKTDLEEAVWTVRVICDMLESDRYRKVLASNHSFKSIVCEVLQQVPGLEVEDDSLISRVNQHFALFQQQ